MNTTFIDTRLIRAIGALQPRTKGMKNLALAQLYCWGLNRQKFGHPIEISFYRQQADIGSRQTIYDHLELLRAKGLVQKSDAEKWTVCPDSQNRLSEIWDDLSKKLASGVQKPDNTKEKNLSKNLLREAGQEVLKTWNSHATSQTYLKKRNSLLAEDNTVLSLRMEQFPEADVARVLDRYLKTFPDLLKKRASESGRPWTLKQVLNFPTFSEKLDDLAGTDWSSDTDQTASVMSVEACFLRHHLSGLVDAKVKMSRTAKGLDWGKEQGWTDEIWVQKHAEAWETMYGVPFDE